jgi:hypothetical protein
VVVLGGAGRLEADEAVGVAVVGDERLIGGVSFFDDRAAVVVVVDVAAVACAVADSEAFGVVVVEAENGLGGRGAAGGLDEVVAAVVGEGGVLVGESGVGFGCQVSVVVVLVDDGLALVFYSAEPVGFVVEVGLGLRGCRFREVFRFAVVALEAEG